MRSTQKAGVPLLQSIGCSNPAPPGLSLPCSPTLPHLWDIMALDFRGGTDQPFWHPNSHLGASNFTLTPSLSQQNTFSSRNTKPAWQRWEGRWGCVSRGDLGSVLLTGQGCTRWESLLTILPAKPPSLQPAASAALWAGQPRRLGGRETLPSLPKCHQQQLLLQSFPPPPGLGKGSWGWSWEGRTAPLSHSPRFDSLYEHDPPIRNQGLISQLTASSSIISIQTN